MYGKITLALRRFEAYAGSTMHRLTPLGVGLIIAAALLLLIGCGDGGNGASDPTPQPTGQIDATATLQTDVQPPPRPADFAGYPAAIAAYLTEAGDAALGSPCLAELLAVWQMPAAPQPALAPVASILEDGCLLANTDADSDLEVVVALTFAPDEDFGFGILSNLVIFDRADTVAAVAFESSPPGSEQYPDLAPITVLAIADMNGDGAGDLVYAVTTCGAHTCTHTVHAVSSDGTAYIKLTPDEGISMTTADIFLDDEDGDGVQDIVLHGGTISSIGAGAQRTRTEVYAWNGELYELAETIFDASGLLYFAIRDADMLFDAGDYLDAAQAYTAALADDSLAESGFQENERAELSAYATFRIGLSQLANGGSILYAYFPDEDLGILNNTLSTTFAPAYEASGDLHGACLAVRDHITANLNSFQAIWEYGYANPTFDAENVCPF